MKQIDRIFGMRRLLDYIALERTLKHPEIRDKLDISRQNYYTLQNGKFNQLMLIVKIKKTFNLTWEEVGKALEYDYSDDKKKAKKQNSKSIKK